MKKILFILCLFVLISSSSLYAGEAWSPFSGKKTWQEAKEHCTGLGMRLPTSKELIDLVKRDSDFSKLGKKVWASNLYATSIHDVMNLQKKGLEHHLDESSLGVICLPVTPESMNEEKERNKSEEKYSGYMGKMNWDDAYEKCKSLGMRLPTLGELEDSYKAGITKSWIEDGDDYWSSTPYDAERYYNFRVNSGYSRDYRRGVNIDVRCRR